MRLLRAGKGRAAWEVLSTQRANDPRKPGKPCTFTVSQAAAFATAPLHEVFEEATDILVMALHIVTSMVNSPCLHLY